MIRKHIEYSEKTGKKPGFPYKLTYKTVCFCVKPYFFPAKFGFLSKKNGSKNSLLARFQRRLNITDFNRNVKGLI
ncbi:hypothetical protein CH352_02780 [Leptospira hartskeerlii]|nr:hypothetical protein CH352_02780 [Leptospira hartskeerlii]